MYKLILCLFIFNLSASTRKDELIINKIQENKQNFFADLHEVHLNFIEAECSFCKEQDSGQEVETRLLRKGLHRVSKSNKASFGHCQALPCFLWIYVLSGKLKKHRLLQRYSFKDLFKKHLYKRFSWSFCK